ncbi:putative outer protein E, partial [Chlamydia psittaci 84-8471/1]
DVIASTVESMIVADVNGQQLVELVLDAEGNVPEVFAGANLTLVQSGTDLSVKFSNFMDDVQLTEAVNLISNNPSQLAGLVESLKNLRLNLTELTVGTSIVQLPTIEEV